MRFAWAAVLLLLCGNLSAFAQTTLPVRSRADFAAAMAKVQRHMPESQVVALLGQPDDVRTAVDENGPDGKYTKEIWCYGTDEHMGFPTLGCVYIETNGLAEEIFGGQGQPPSTNLFTEAELQKLLRLMNGAPITRTSYFNPLSLIQVVNALQPLGRDKALAVIDEYIRVTSGRSQGMDSRDRIRLVLLVLFDLPDDVDPRSADALGMASQPSPKDFHRMPRFPIVLVDDIPLLMEDHSSWVGRPTPLEYVVRFFCAHGVFRSKLLMPRDNPLGALKKLVNSDQWAYDKVLLTDPDDSSDTVTSKMASQKIDVMEQLLRMINSVYRLPVNDYGYRLPCPCDTPPDSAWAKIADDVAALKIKWDPSVQIYTFRDGRFIAPPAQKIYHRVIWQLTGMGASAEMVMERKNDDLVNITLTTTRPKGDPMQHVILELFGNGTNQNSLGNWRINQTGGSDVGYWNNAFHIKDGDSVTACVTMLGYQTNTSPVLKL